MSNLWDLNHIQPRHDVVIPGETIPELFWNAVRARGDKTFMREKTLGIWRAWSWNQTGVAVREIAVGLAALDLAPGDVASIQSNTVVEWVLADLGTLSAGGVSNGIYPTDAAVQVQYLCEDSRTTLLFVEDEEQLDKALEVRDRLPLLARIVVFDMEGLDQLNDPQVMSLVLRALHAASTPGSCGAALDASSLMTVNAVQGVASFYGLKSSTVASGCTLTATSGSMPSAVSAAFDIQ